MALARRAVLWLVLLSVAPAHAAAAPTTSGPARFRRSPAPRRLATDGVDSAARRHGARRSGPMAGRASTSNWRARACDQCAAGGARASFSALAANKIIASGDYVGWTFTAPTGTTIANYTLWRTFRPASGWTSSGAWWSHSYFLGEDGRATFESGGVEACIESRASARRSGVTRRSRSPTPIASAAATWRSSACTRRWSASHRRRAHRRRRRAASDLRGARRALRSELAGDHQRARRPAARQRHPAHGRTALRLAVRDAGGGIERVGIVVDGRAVVSRPLDLAAASCVARSRSSRPARERRRDTLVFDTAHLPNGPHTIQASVTDAAGNETRSDPVSVTTLNGSQPNGRGASRFVKLSAWLRSKRDKPRRAAVVPYGSTPLRRGAADRRAAAIPSPARCCRPAAASAGPVRST